MRKLSRDEMKKIIGGKFHEAMVTCNDGTNITSTNECSNSVGVCNSNGGFTRCTGSYYS